MHCSLKMHRHDALIMQTSHTATLRNMKRKTHSLPPIFVSSSYAQLVLSAWCPLHCSAKRFVHTPTSSCGPDKQCIAQADLVRVFLQHDSHDVNAFGHVV